MAGTTNNDITLAYLAKRFDLKLIHGNGSIVVAGVCALAPGQANRITFADATARKHAIENTAAAAVVLPDTWAESCRAPALVTDQPRLMFARIAALFEGPLVPAGVHASAIVDASATVDPSAGIGPQVTIGARCVVAADSVIDAGTVVGPDVQIGRDARIASNVSIGARTRIGAGVRIEANAAIGGRGFGLVYNGSAWEAIPQLGGVRIADDVEIGAGTTIDRGAIEDTVIETGVKIDDQVHIGHNCVIGAHTVIAGCTGIAGSCVIGAHCMIGGGVGIGDHVRIADGVIITAASQVPKDIDKGGVYSSTFRAMPAADWRKRLALFRQLDRFARRLQRVERAHGTGED